MAIHILSIPSTTKLVYIPHQTSESGDSLTLP